MRMVINEEASANTMHRRRQLQNWKSETLEKISSEYHETIEHSKTN